MCVFCKIINNELPSSVVYEDDDFLAILALPQATKGHTLVMPKKHFENIYETDDDLLAKYLLVTKKVMTKLKKLNPKGFNILNNLGETAGQTIMHTHVHIIPRYDEKDVTIKLDERNDLNLSDVLKEIL